MAKKSKYPLGYTILYDEPCYNCRKKIKMRNIVCPLFGGITQILTRIGGRAYCQDCLDSYPDVTKRKKGMKK